MNEEKLRKIISLYREKVNTKEDGVFKDWKFCSYYWIFLNK